MTYDNTNTGFLVPNRRKEDESDEDSFGKLFVGEIEHKLKAWISDDHTKMDLEFTRADTRGDNKGSGHMTRNSKSSEKQPDWKGKIKTASGEEFAIAGWKKERKGKDPLLSLKVSTPRGRSSQTQAKEEKFPI